MEDLAEFSVEYARKKGASYAEARFQDSSTNSFVLKNGALQGSSFAKISGIGMRFLAENSLGFFSTNRLDKDNIRVLIDKAIKSTRAAKKIAEDVRLAEDEVNKRKYEVNQKIKLEDVGADEKIKLLMEAEKAMRDTGANLASSFISFSDDVTTEYLVNSEGTKITATVPKANIWYLITVNHGTRSSQRYWTFGGTGGYEIVKAWNVPDVLRREVVMTRKNLKEGIKLKPGKMDVVVGPQVVGIMVHESVGHPAEADRIFGREAAQAGESYINKEDVGRKIGSEAVNIVDDPTVEGAYGYYLYDNEGVKARRKLLITHGVIGEFLHNRETAVHMGLRSNGSSRATEYNRESIVRMSNTFLLPGDYKEQELIEAVKNGVYMRNFNEWNIDDKRLNQRYVGAEAYLIKNGKIMGPVFQPTIEINTPDLWGSVDAAADNVEYHSASCGKGEPMQPVPVWHGGPSMRIRGIRLS